MMHVGEYKCFECKNWLCHEHALQHFSGGRRTRPLQCEQLDIANEVIAEHEAQVASLTKERDEARAQLREHIAESAAEIARLETNLCNSGKLVESADAEIARLREALENLRGILRISLPEFQPKGGDAPCAAKLPLSSGSNAAPESNPPVAAHEQSEPVGDRQEEELIYGHLRSAAKLCVSTITTQRTVLISQRSKVDELTADRDALKAEVERLRAEGDGLQGAHTRAVNWLKETAADRDRLQAENEELKNERDKAVAEAKRRDQKWMDGINHDCGQDINFDPLGMASLPTLGDFIRSLRAQNEELQKLVAAKDSVLRQCSGFMGVPAMMRGLVKSALSPDIACQFVRREWLTELTKATIRAHSDPGAFTPRADNYTEALGDWQKRALEIALTRAEAELTKGNQQ